MHRGLIAAMLAMHAADALLAPQHVRRTQTLAASVDVADLKVSMDDLHKPLEELMSASMKVRTNAGQKFQQDVPVQLPG